MQLQTIPIITTMEYLVQASYIEFSDVSKINGNIQRSQETNPPIVKTCSQTKTGASPNRACRQESKNANVVVFSPQECPPKLSKTYKSEVKPSQRRFFVFRTPKLEKKKKKKKKKKKVKKQNCLLLKMGGFMAS
jgi:hypothetical protein